MKKVGIIHTSFVSVEVLKNLFKELLPEVQTVNIVDDSLLAEVKTVGHVTPQIIRRMSKYAQELEALGCVAILNQCSSVSEAVDVVQESISIPYVKVDGPMAERAVELGGRISVIATVASTMGPSCRLVESTARARGKTVEVVPCLVDGAMNVLIYEGNVEKHNAMVLEAIERVAPVSDVIVLAQGSMIVLLDRLGHIKTPILTSPRSGVEGVKRLLESL